MRLILTALGSVQFIAGLLVIAVVLLQQGKGSSMSAAFGTVGTQTFGARTDEFMTKATRWCAGVFLVASLLLALFSGGGIVRRTAAEAPPLQPLSEVAEAPAEGG
jgi:preprotein translocase subunit SecG